MTLAAKLANKELFDHMMQIRKNIEWVFGEVECATFPLDDVDTVSWLSCVHLVCVYLNILQSLGHKRICLKHVHLSKH